MAKSKKEGIYCGAKFYLFTYFVPYFQLIISYLLNYTAGRPYKSIAIWQIGKTVTATIHGVRYANDRPYDIKQCFLMAA